MVSVNQRVFPIFFKVFHAFVLGFSWFFSFFFFLKGGVEGFEMI